MKKGLLPLGLLVSILVTDFDANAQSLKWYKEHDKERNEKVEECRKASDPRDTEDSRNAINASFRSGSYTHGPNKSW